MIAYHFGFAAFCAVYAICAAIKGAEISSLALAVIAGGNVYMAVGLMT